jgi:hypothetical protein
MSRLRLSDAVKTTLALGMVDTGAGYSYKVELVNAPDGVFDQAGKVKDGHVIISPIGSASGESSMNDEFEIVDYEYQTTCVATSRQSAEWMSDRVRLVMVGRAASGAFLFPISPVSGGTICDRRVALFGGVTSDAPGVFTVQDSYYVIVS